MRFSRVSPHRPVVTADASGGSARWKAGGVVYISNVLFAQEGVFRVVWRRVGTEREPAMTAFAHRPPLKLDTLTETPPPLSSARSMVAYKKRQNQACSAKLKIERSPFMI